MGDALSVYYPEDIETFKKDLLLLMGVTYQLDTQYGAAEVDCDADCKKFKKLAYDWNLKYKHLIIRTIENGIEFSLKILLNEKDLKKVFLDAAIKIGEATSVNGLEMPADALSEQSLRHILKQVGDRLDIIYGGEDGEKENSLTIEYDDTYERARLIFEKNDMLDSSSPEFKICAYYALKEVKKDVNLQKYAGEFSFDIDIQESEGKGDGYDARVPLYPNSNNDS